MKRRVGWSGAGSGHELIATALLYLNVMIVRERNRLL